MSPQTNNKDSSNKNDSALGAAQTVVAAAAQPEALANADNASVQLHPVPEQSPRRDIFKWVVSVLLLTAIAVLAIVAINSQKISDWWRLRGYAPPPLVSSLATQDTMNSYTRHLFYLNKPQILNTVASFRKYCPENENTIVLGCYHSGQNGIFIYNVPDPTLAGVQEVTAAHEVLHSIYARLSSSQRANVDGLLENYYKHDLHDPRVLAEVKLYQQTEPHDVMDEMNSTFGTEISALPAPLEAYYRQYFTDRSAIVTYEQRYQGELSGRLNTINADDQQLTSLQQDISAQETSLNSSLSHLNQARSQLNQLLSEGQSAEYNAGVGGYNAQIDSYNQLVAKLQSNINSYNQLVETRNLVAGQLTTLDKALDTRLTEQTTSKT